MGLSQTKWRKKKSPISSFLFSHLWGKIGSAVGQDKHLGPEAEGKIRDTELLFIWNLHILFMFVCFYFYFLKYRLKILFLLLTRVFRAPLNVAPGANASLSLTSLGPAYEPHQESPLQPKQKVHQDSFWIPLSPTWPCTPDSGRLCMEQCGHSEGWRFLSGGLALLIGIRVKYFFFFFLPEMT